MTDLLAVDFALVCDEVRREDNAKLIFLGVFGRDIGVNQLPATISLTLVVFVDARILGETDIEVEAFAGEASINKARGHIAIHAAGKNVFSIPGLLFPGLQNACDLHFTWRELPNGKPRTILTVPFVGVRGRANGDGPSTHSSQSPPGAS